MIRAEWTKQWGRRRTLVLVAAAALFPIVMTVALVGTGSGKVERVGDIPLVLVPAQSGLSVPLISLSSTMRFFLPLLIAVVAGEAIAGEAATGRLRYALAGPRSRARYLLSKAGVAASICVVLLAVLFVVSVAAGLVAFGWHPLIPLNGSQSAISTVAAFSPASALAKLGVGIAYVAAGMASVFSFAMLLSTVTTRPFVAVAGAVGLSVLSRVFNADYLPGVGAVSRYMPNNDIDLWQHLFANPADTAGMGRFLLLQTGYFALFSVAAWWLFTRRDVLT